MVLLAMLLVISRSSRKHLRMSRTASAQRTRTHVVAHHHTEPRAASVSPTRPASEAAAAVLAGTALTHEGVPVSAFLLCISSAATVMVQPTVIADADGRFHVAPLTPGRYTCDARLLNSSVTTNVFLTAGTNEWQIVFDGVYHLCVTGEVLFSTTRAPAPNVEVTYTPGDAGLPATIARTSRQGRFAMRIAVASGAALGMLSAHELGYAPATYMLGTSYGGECVTILLFDGGVLRGTLRTSQYEPIAGAVVRIKSWLPDDMRMQGDLLWAWERAGHQQRFVYSSPPSGTDGSYVMSNVAAPLLYWLETHAPGFSELGPQAWRPIDVRVEPHCVTERDLVLCRHPELYLKVRDKDGAPVLQYDLAYTHVSLSLSSEELHAQSERVSLTQDEWHRLTLTNTIHGMNVAFRISISAPGIGAIATNIMVYVGDAPLYLTVPINQAGVQLSGRAVVRDGASLSSALLSASTYEQPARGETRVRTDHDGRFAVAGLPVQPGDAISLRYHNAITSFPCGARMVVFQADAGFHVLTGRVTGRVALLSPQTPASNFMIVVEARRYDNHCVFNPDGIFNVPVVDAGKGTVRASALGYTTASAEFNMDAGGVADVGTLVLQHRAGIVRGRVLLPSGEPVTATIILRVGQYSDGPVRFSRDDGVYLFGGVPPGQVVVAARRHLAGSAQAGPLPLEPGGTLVMPDIVLAPASGTYVTVTLLLPNGAAASDAWVFPMTFSREGDRSDARGCIRRFLPPDIPQTWVVQHQADVYEAVPFTPLAGVTAMNMALRACPRISGTVTYGSAPVERSILTFKHSDGLYLIALVSCGAFDISAVPGEYEVLLNTRLGVVNATVRLFEGSGNVIAF